MRRDPAQARAPRADGDPGGEPSAERFRADPTPAEPRLELFDDAEPLLDGLGEEPPSDAAPRLPLDVEDEPAGEPRFPFDGGDDEAATEPKADSPPNPADEPPAAESEPQRPGVFDDDATLLEPRAVAPIPEPVAEEPARDQPAVEPPPRPASPPPHDHHAAPVPAVPARPFVFDPLRPYRGVVRRFFVVYKHVLGLLAGGSAAYVRALPRERRHGLHSWFPRLTASIVWPFLDREIRKLPFPQQLRRRLEILGPTYIKLGQIMAIREDLLPRSITRELQNLFDRLPAIPFTQVREIIERSFAVPLEELFASVDEKPIGSASIAQAHLARTRGGESVVVKVIKPGVREMIESDLTLLGMVGSFLQWVIPRYMPKQIVAEFSAYTRKEVDYNFEADNAETFAANFRDMPDVAFPRIHRDLSSGDVLTMEFMRGFKPGSEPTEDLTQEERERVIDLGAASIIRMLYRDGFFHADLHAGNLMILPGKSVRVAFIDLGMVGRFEERTRRQMLYYFHALVTGDVDGSTRYLTDMATVGKGGDPQGFRRAVADLSRRFIARVSRGDISIAQLILESVGLGGRYRVFFPVEMTLMVKALVTFEGVGRMLDPQLDVAAVSRKHVSKIFQQQFDPRLLLRQVLRGSPELVDVAVRLPQLLSAGFKFADEHLNNRPPSNPLQGIKGSILAAACIVGGVLAAIQHASPLLWGGMFLLAVLLSLFGR
ncbi:MAG TPA: AarF/UbiB family protein [Longimicrobium sp.]